MFLDEARLGARMSHSNVVQTIELGQQEGRYFIAMEYVAGMPLSVLARKALERKGGLPVEITLAILAQACAGLHYAHELRLPDETPLHIVHRDVSPQNLIVTFDGVVKVVDFGVARADVRDSKTKSGLIKGKFAYMSPEQCLAKPLDRRTDVFALGVIAHELLTGRRLFRRATPYETYQAIVSGREIPRPSEVYPALDPELDGLVLRALAYHVDDRYPTAEAMADAIQEYLHRRGKPIGMREVGRYMEEHFATEIAEHAGRLGALLSGRISVAGEPVGRRWDEDDGAGADGEGAEPTRVDTPLPGRLVAVSPSEDAPAGSRDNAPLRGRAAVARDARIAGRAAAVDAPPPGRGAAGATGAAGESVSSIVETIDRRLDDLGPRPRPGDTPRDASPARLREPGAALPDSRPLAPTGAAVGFWVYPLVFLAAAALGVLALLLVRWLR